MNRPRHLTAVLFDLDGTLIDTAVEFITVVRQIRERYGLPPLKDCQIRALVSEGATALVKLALEINENHPNFYEHKQNFLNLYGQIAGSKCKPFQGILNTIKWLNGEQIKWGIATNKPRNFTDSLLKKISFNPAPQCVVCPEDIKNPKPSPEALLLSCKKLKCKPNESVYIGDHFRDIEAGRRAGMYTIVANYGYIASTQNPKKWGANALAKNAMELKDLLVLAFPDLKRT